MSGPGIPPRPRPGGVKAPLPTPPTGRSGGSGGGAPPPLPLPRSNVSSLAQNFGGGAKPVSNHGASVSPTPAKPSEPPPPLPHGPRPSVPQLTQSQAEVSPTATRPAPAPRSGSAPALPPDLPPPRGGGGPPALPPDRPQTRSSVTAPAVPPERPQQTPDRPQLPSDRYHPRASSTSDGERFGNCLQNCYDTITKRHEDELLVLESLRGHVFNRSRLDKEYAENLAKTNSKASRKMANVSNKSSAIVQVRCGQPWHGWERREIKSARVTGGPNRGPIPYTNTLYIGSAIFPSSLLNEKEKQFLLPLPLHPIFPLLFVEDEMTFCVCYFYLRGGRSIGQPSYTVLQ